MSKWIDGEYSRTPRTQEMDANKAMLAALVVAGIVILGYAATHEGQKTQGQIWQDNASEIYDKHFITQGVDAVVNEPDGDSVAFRQLPVITEDNDGESNIITTIPSGESLRGIMVQTDTGELWLETKIDGEIGFVKRTNLDFLTTPGQSEVFDIRTGNVAPLYTR